MTALPRAASIDTIVWLAERNVEKTTDIIEWAIKESSAAFLIPVEDIKGSERKGQIKMIRHLLMYALRFNHGQTTIEIGRHFNNRDHTTVVNSCQVVVDFFDSEDKLFIPVYQRMSERTTILDTMPIPRKRKRQIIQDAVIEVYDRKATYSNHSPMGIAQ